jgi:AcrR family transcriptional regulator
MARPRLGTHSVPTEQRILKAAESEFGINGYERARLEDIAKCASIRRPSLLYHFNSKEALYAKVVRGLFDSLRKVLVASMSGTVNASFSEQVEALVGGFLEFVESRPAFSPIVIREIVDGRGPAREILLKEIAPLLGTVETWVEQQGDGKLPPGVSVRAALLQIISDVLLREASGPLREPLWGESNSTMPLVRQLFLGTLQY